MSGSAESSYSAMPSLAGACDCHMHLYDSRFAAVAGARLMPPDASAASYRAVQARLGLERVVVVAPSTYGTDTAYVSWALEALGPGARGIAVVDPEIDAAALRRLHGQGVRGVRYNQTLGFTPLASLEAVAARIAPLGWHVELLLPSDELAAAESRLRALPVPIVFDHLGRLPASGLRHPGFGVIERLLETGRAWVKLSGAYLAHPLRDGGWPDAEPLARRLLELAPERMVWGSNWPHPTASTGQHDLPDDRLLLQALVRWTGDDAALLRRVLVTNPEALYDFPPAA